MDGLRGLSPSKSQDVTILRFQVLGEGKVWKCRRDNVSHQLRKRCFLRKCLSWENASDISSVHKKLSGGWGSFDIMRCGDTFPLLRPQPQPFSLFIGQSQLIQSNPLFSHRHLKRPNSWATHLLHFQSNFATGTKDGGISPWLSYHNGHMEWFEQKDWRQLNTFIDWPYVIQFCNESSFQKKGLSLHDDNYVTFHELGVFGDRSESAMPEQCRQLWCQQYARRHLL